MLKGQQLRIHNSNINLQGDCNEQAKSVHKKASRKKEATEKIKQPADDDPWFSWTW